MQKQFSDISPGQAGDIPAISVLERAYYGVESYPAGFLYQALAQWPQGLWVAKQEHQVTGYALVAPAQSPSEYWLMAALVAEQARGQGLGEKLCASAISSCTQLGASKLWLSVAPDNHGAIRLYRKLGFVDAGQHVDFLGPGEHRLVMQLQLN